MRSQRTSRAARRRPLAMIASNRPQRLRLSRSMKRVLRASSFSNRRVRLRGSAVALKLRNSFLQRPAAAPPRRTPGMLSDAQRRFFADEGYLVLPGALLPSELAAARRAGDAAEARWRADPSLPGVRR